ncbi:MAG: hypothetical protein JXA78_01035 [Anaerolineales bacterium]|nr:hypothetical protein [Anaerolineales bacterium]
MSILYVAAGFLMLLVGRPAYMTFTGGVSLIVGAYLAKNITLISSAEWNNVVLPLLFIVFGILAALVFRRWAARLAGFLAGGFVAYNLPTALGAASGWQSWIIFAIAGGICVALLMIWFDVVMILLSTLMGVTLILQRVNFGSLDNVTMFIILTLFGIIAQFLIFQYGRPSPD